MILSDFSIECFEYLYRKLRNDYQYSVKIVDRDKTMMSNFLKSLDGKIGLESLNKRFVFEYLCYQFNYWRESDEKTFMKGLPLNWVFGEKALERWFGISNWSGQWYHILKWVTDYGVRWDDLEKPYKMDLENLHDHEELEKSRYWGSNKSLAHCIVTTTLFHPKSKWCKVCIHGVECKNSLQKLYPGLYRKRIVNENRDVC